MNRIHASLDNKVLPASVRKTETEGILWEISGQESQPPNARGQEPRYYVHSMGSTFEIFHACTTEKEANGFCETCPAGAVIETRPDGVILIAKIEGTTPAMIVDAFIPNHLLPDDDL